MIPVYEANQENKLIDLQQYLIRNQPATIAVRCGNESMCDAGISTDDILIIDRSIEAQNGNVVMADIGHAFTIRRLVLTNGISWLNSENSAASFDNHAFQPNKDMAIIGVVTFVIKAFQ